MKKFKFKLEPFLKYRAYQEHQQKLVVAKARTDVLNCEQEIERCKTEQATAHSRLDAGLASGVAAQQFQYFCNYFSGLERVTDLENERLNGFLDVLSKQQKELTQKSVARKVIGNLKERRKEEYYSQMLENEQKEMDDTVILRHIRAIPK